MHKYSLIRSKRKTLAIHICDNKVEVRAPLFASKSYIDSFVKEKEKWIISKLDEQQSILQLKQQFCLAHGDKIAFLGKDYPITIADNQKGSFDYKHFYLPSNLNFYERQAVCIKIYKELAEGILRTKTLFFANKIGVTPKKIKINNAGKRWGSCSSKGNINFSWKLIMADEVAVDYVVIHELVHLLELNHSFRFWEIVENEFPNYKDAKRILNHLGRRLIIEKWSK